MRVGLGSLVVCAVLVAGCSGSSDDKGAIEEFASSEQLFDANTGAIAGLVTDDSLAPLEAVTVTLDGTKQTASGPDGSFGFAFVDPGTHQVVASAPGHVDTSVDVDVATGVSVRVSLRLLVEPSLVPYHATLVKSGVVGCAAAFTNPTPQGQSVAQLPVCPLVGRTTGTASLDQGSSFYQITLVDSVGFWGETTWRSNQALGSALNATYAIPGDEARLTSRSPTRAGGVSPLRVVVPMSVLEKLITDYKSPLCNFEKCSLDIYHSAHPEFPAGSPFKAGAVIQQRFDDYLSIFYRGELPSEFTALPDQ